MTKALGNVGSKTLHELISLGEDVRRVPRVLHILFLFLLVLRLTKAIC